MKVDRQERFLIKAKEIHGDKYDYSKVEYVDAHTKVCIICPIHGEFWASPNTHLNGHGCPVCGKNKRLTTDEFIKRAKEIHGDKYDYSKVEYVRMHDKVCIICPIHGEFLVSPANHLKERGCPKCKSRKHLVTHYKSKNERIYKKHTTESFINKAKLKHGNKYDYSKVEYINNKTKVCIICPEHGEFWMRPDCHLNGQGCKKCGDATRFETKKTYKEDWIKAAKELHGDKYDYSKVEYINATTPVCIICPKHGEFLQKPMVHMNGMGCPYCAESYIEQLVCGMLKHEEIDFKYNYRPDWLNGLELDFYLPKYNIGIECQGEQHFKPIDYFGGLPAFIKILEHDEAKKVICGNKGVKLLFYSRQKRNNMITDINILKDKIYETNC